MCACANWIRRARLCLRTGVSNGISKQVLKTYLKETLGAAHVPPPCIAKSDFFWLPLRTLIFAEKVRKWETNGDPNGTNRCAESAQGLPKMPLRCVPEAIFMKIGDLHET